MQMYVRILVPSGAFDMVGPHEAVNGHYFRFNTLAHGIGTDVLSGTDDRRQAGR